MRLEGLLAVTIEIGSLMTEPASMGEPEYRQVGCGGCDLDLWVERARRHGLVASERVLSV